MIKSTVGYREAINKAIQRTAIGACRTRFLLGTTHSVGRNRAQKMLGTLRRWLPETGKILDIGTGMGYVAEAIQDAGYRVVACDIADLCLVDLPRVLANGTKLPFPDSFFNASLLITVLHHLPIHLHIPVLLEGVRVLHPRGRLLVLEDTYHGSFERFVTFMQDSIMNLEFIGHPHSNRNLAGWVDLINQLGLRLIYQSEYTAWFGPFRMRHAILVVEQAETGSRLFQR